jgi:hypothetical protein
MAQLMLITLMLITGGRTSGRPVIFHAIRLGNRRRYCYGGAGLVTGAALSYGRSTPSRLSAYQGVLMGIFSTLSPVCGASMM